MKNNFLKTIGWLCIIVGIFGLVLPLFQGVFLIVLGLFLLSKSDPSFKKKLLSKFDSFMLRFPKIESYLRRARDFVESKLK